MKFFKQSSARYGLVMCGLIVLCLATMEISGQNLSFDKSPLQAIFMFFAPFVIWFLGIKAKKKALKGKLTFKQGLVEGFKISLIYGIISPFIFLVYYLFINPEIVNYARTAYQMTGASFETVVAVDMVVQFIFAVVFGTLYSALVSFFLKTKS